MKSLIRAKTKAVPPTFQVAQTECGLCCVRSLLASLGHDRPLHELRAMCEPGRDGLSMRQLAGLLERLHCKTRILRVRKAGALAQIAGPYIAFWNEHHYVVVEHFGRRGVTVMDPMLGRIRLSMEDFVAGFSNVVLVAEPTPAFARRRTPMLRAWRGKPLLPEKSIARFAIMTTLSVLTIATTTLVPIATQRIIDGAVTGKLSLTAVSVMLVVAALAFLALSMIRTAVALKLARSVSLHIVSRAFIRLMSLPMRYFLARPPGEIMYRLGSLQQVQDLITSRVVQAAVDLLTSGVLLVYVYWHSVALGHAVLAATLCSAVVSGSSQRRIQRLTDFEMQSTATSQSIQLDALVSVGNIRLRGYESDFIEDWRGAYSGALDAMVRRSFLQQGIVGSALSAIQVFGPVATIALASFLYVQGSISLGVGVAVQGVAALLFSVSNSLASAVADFAIASKALERTDDIFETPTERNTGTATQLTSASIDLEDVRFRFSEGEPEVLHGVSVSIQPGERVALVGPSGSGKSTLAQIAATLYRPTSGRVRVGGKAVEDYDLSALRRSFGYVPQEGYLHNRSILENLTLGADIEADEALQRCSRMPFLDFVQDLAMGFHTIVANMGANISGGQRQRILIARALLTNPQLLIFDEATASLDNESQRMIHDHIRSIGVTALLVAHRLSTVIDADRILVMEHGRIVETGSHAQLMRGRGTYSRLFAHESLREAS